MSDPLPIVVYSDVICPWCYVGKRRLEAALVGPRHAPGIPGLRFSWRPFELNPDMPAEGIERKVYRARKFGEARSAELDVRRCWRPAASSASPSPSSACSARPTRASPIA